VPVVDRASFALFAATAVPSAHSAADCRLVALLAQRIPVPAPHGPHETILDDGSDQRLFRWSDLCCART
jgi:hypothetical protein